MTDVLYFYSICPESRLRRGYAVGLKQENVYASHWVRICCYGYNWVVQTDEEMD